MNNEYPITPPPELVEQWVAEIWHEGTPVRVAQSDLHLAAATARWGADQELEACCEWLEAHFHGMKEWAAELRTARRPKPPSLKERALEVLGRVSKDGYPCNYQDDEDWNTIRQALELLPDEVQ